LKTHEKRFKRIRLKRPKLFETIIWKVENPISKFQLNNVSVNEGPNEKCFKISTQQCLS
jgi:hypothetical protein